MLQHQIVMLCYYFHQILWLCNLWSSIPPDSGVLQVLLPVHVPGLVVQSEEGHGRVDGLSALGTQPHHLQARLVDLLSELIHGDVTWSAHKNWPAGEFKSLIATPSANGQFRHNSTQLNFVYKAFLNATTADTKW